MKNKIGLLIILIITFYIGILVGTPFKTEVVDLKQFTDYYEEGEAKMVVGKFKQITSILLLENTL